MNGLQVPMETGQPQILLLEDELYLGKGLQMALTDEGYRVDLTMRGLEALDAMKMNDFHLLVADLRLPDIDGMEVVKRVKQTQPAVEVIVITGYPSVSSATTAMKMGAFEYLPKPFTDDEFKLAVRGALRRREKIFQEDVALSEKNRLIERQEVVRVLDRASEDAAFWVGLLDRGSSVLSTRALSREAQAAILSGDLNWLEEKYGKLTHKQLLWIRSRLEQENW